MTDVLPPAARPCGTCPYRRDVPSGVWHPSEYAKLPDYDQPTGDQPLGVFMCHQQDGRVCAGWAGCHDMTHTLAVRVGAAAGHLTTDTVNTLLDYTTPTPLFTSGTEAAEHGLADVNSPDHGARRAIDTLTRKRATRQQPAGSKEKT